MLRIISKAFFLVLFISVNGFAQTIVEPVALKWDPQPREYAITEDQSLSYFYFEGAAYDEANPHFPIYSKKIELRTYGDLTPVLINAQYEPITVPDGIDFSNIGDLKLNSSVSFQRRQPMGVVYFNPIRKNPLNGQYERLVSADLQINIIPKTSPYSGGASTSRNNVTTSKFADGQIYKIAINNTGIYKIDYNFLKDLGVDVDNIDPRNIQLLGNGGNVLPELMTVAIPDDIMENAIFVSGQADGSFDASDYILFYGVGTKNWSFNSSTSCGTFGHSVNPYTDNSYYFIKIGSTAGKRLTTNTSLTNTNYSTTTYDALAHHELDDVNLMEQEFALPPSGRLWYGESFQTQNNRSRTFNFAFRNRVESEPITVFSNLAVRAFSTGLVTVRANNVTVGQPLVSPFTTQQIYTDYAKNLTIPCTQLTVPNQNIDIRIDFDHTSTAADMWLNYISLRARCQLSFTGGQMDFRDIESAGQGSASYQLANASNVTIWDITDPYNVKRQEYNKNGSNINFGADATNLHQFVAFDNSNFYTPTRLGAVANQNLHGITSPPDAIFVYHGGSVDAFNLQAQAERLAAHRRSHSNLTVDVIDVQDIYNEFSSGNPDITAIRNFCKLLYERETPSNKFTHLLLFGIGTFDYKHIGNTRNASNNPNLIPVYETLESLHPINTYTSDDYFALLDTLERMSAYGLLDIAVGRLPAANKSEAEIFVDKIIKYDTDPSFMRDWKNRLCFMADDGDNNLHLNDAEAVINSALQSDNTFNVEKIYLDAYNSVSTSGGTRYPDAKNALLDVLFKGSFVVNYLGHGGDDGWTQERVFTSPDVKALTNGNKLPLFITATCSFGPHDDPTSVSAGELLLLNPFGGAISVFTTLRVVIASHNKQLVDHTFQVIFKEKADGTMPTTGEVMQFAKNNAGISPPTNSRKYALLGDPTMSLAYPTYNVRTDSINGDVVGTIDTISALQKVTIQGSIVDDNNVLKDDFDGVIYPTVYDKEDRLFTLGNSSSSYPSAFLIRKKIIFKGKASVSGGKFTFSFVVPKDINYSIGQGKISYYAENTKDLDAKGAYYNLAVGGSYNSAEIDNQGPEVQVYMNTEEFVRGGITDDKPNLLVKLFDDNGINTVGNSIGHDLTGTLTTLEGVEEEYILNDFYESTQDDYRSGTVIYPLKSLQPGLHTIKVKAWDVYNNPGEGDTEFVVAESADLALKHVLNYPNPFTTSTNFQFEHNYPYQSLDVQVQIYTVSGRLVKTINHNINAEANNGYRVTDIHWDGLDDYGDRLGKGVYIYKVFVQAENTTDQAKQNSEFQKLVILK